MANSWTGRSTQFAAKIASAWGTEVAIGAASGIKMGALKTLLGPVKAEPEKTIDTAFPTAVTIGNVDPVEYPVELMPRFTSSTSVCPVDQFLMANIYAATTATQQGVTAAYLHTGTVASDVAYAAQPTRFFTLAGRYVKTSGYAYASIPSWMPNGFEISSEAGSPLKLTVNGIGNKVLFDGATNGATQWGNVTYLDATGRLANHHHLANDGTNGGCWLAKSAAVGGSPVTWTRAAARIQPTSISVKYDAKMEGVHTDSQYIESLTAGDVPGGTVSVKFHSMYDAAWDSDGVVDLIKDWEAGTESFHHFKARWTWPTAISGSYYPYFEVAMPKLRVTNATYDVESGKVIPLEVEFEILAPTASAHLPTAFTTYGGATNCKDPIMLSIQNQTTAAILA